MGIKGIDHWVMVVGDLHGNIPAFRRFLDLAALEANPGRHLVFQELVHGRRMYPDDAGDRSHQLVDVVCALKCQYPDRVHLILGNHELAQWQAQRIGKGDEDYNEMFRLGVDAAYGPRAADIYTDQVHHAALPASEPNASRRRRTTARTTTQAPIIRSDSPVVIAPSA